MWFVLAACWMVAAADWLLPADRDQLPRMTPHYTILWCDTLECMLMMTPPVTYDVGRQQSPPFVYVPNDDLANKWGPDLEAYYKEPLRTGLQPPFNVNASSVPDFNVTHAYEGRLGRVMDVAMARAGPPDAARLLRFVAEHGPYTVRGNGEEARPDACLDPTGIYSVRAAKRDDASLLQSAYFGYTSCMSMSLVKRDDQTVYRYAGPVTWNRVNFSDSDRVLRLLVTNGRVALPDRNTSFLSQRDFYSCPHSRHRRAPQTGPHVSGADTLPADPGNCTILYGVFEYARACCCPYGQCPLEVHQRDRRRRARSAEDDVRYCPVGRFSSRTSVVVQHMSLNEFERQAKGRFCQTTGMVRFVSDNVTGTTYHQFELVLSATSHFKHMDYVDALLAMMPHNFVCLSGRVRCPLHLDGMELYAGHFNGTCYCRVGQCATIIDGVFDLWNRFMGTIHSGRRTSCVRHVLLAVRDRDHFCESHFDPLLNRTVAMEQFNNYYLRRTVRSFVQDGFIRLQLLLVTVSALVQEQCAPAVRGYGATTATRLLYRVQCRWDMCDASYDRALPALVNGNWSLWPQCLRLSTPNSRFQRTNADLDRVRLSQHTDWVRSSETGFCLMRAISPGADHNGPVFLYELRPVGASELAQLSCPDEVDRDECAAQPGRATLCCRAQFATDDLVKQRLISDLMTYFSADMFATTAAQILHQVWQPESCLWMADRSALMAVPCHHFRGCRRDILFHLPLNEEEGSCLSELGAAAWRGGAPPPSALCGLLEERTGAYRLRRGAHLAAGHRLFRCCTTNAHCSRALPAPLYYADLLDDAPLPPHLADLHR